MKEVQVAMGLYKNSHVVGNVPKSPVVYKGVSARLHLQMAVFALSLFKHSAPPPPLIFPDDALKFLLLLRA
jgi:hypothetical protein